MMATFLNRREFIKILNLTLISCIAPKSIKRENAISSENPPNIIIIVFDAFSAHHIPLFGYPRNTTPNLSRLAEKATIYHNHYAAGNFTTPGTASLLTGTYPWTHRAFRINNKVHEDYQSRNIFHELSDYHRITYSHNSLVRIFQKQFSGDIDYFKPRDDLIFVENKFIPKLFGNDDDVATVSWARTIVNEEEDFSSSLFISPLINYLQKKNTVYLEKDFPLGLPQAGLDSFILEDAIDWLIGNVNQFPQPFFGYFHFLPPHAPYHSRKEFAGAFMNDGFHSKRKPKHLFAKPGKVPLPPDLSEYRRAYDEFILYVDTEFNRLFSAFERLGLLDNTWLLLTSDHGELFERGILGHTTPSLHDPVVRIPLMIFEPGQRERIDIYAATSAVDILPTLLHILDRPIPSWTEGLILPPYSYIRDTRSIFALDAKMNSPDKEIETGSAMIIKSGYKLTNYFGLKFLPIDDPLVELYEIDNDAEELTDISSANSTLVTTLKEEVMAKIKHTDTLLGYIS
jgi:arylsulfatase A-like enzyme